MTEVIGLLLLLATDSCGAEFRAYAHALTSPKSETSELNVKVAEKQLQSCLRK